jgi:phosphoribosylanthranilate isomerase
MAYTRVKICGITRPEDGARTAELGADYIGLNFVGGPRMVNAEQAMAIVQAAPSQVIPVSLVFVDYKPNGNWAGIFKIILDNRALLDRFKTRQVYGLTIELLDQFRVQFGESNVKQASNAFLHMSIAARSSLREIRPRLEAFRVNPAAILLDTASEKLGGTGRSFNWNWIAEAREAGELERLPPIILAGGLTPENVAEAIRIARPYAVDVSSGVEVAGKPGIKDPIKMRDFIQAAKSVG